MKKIIIILTLAFVFPLALAGCTTNINENKDSQADTQNNTEPETNTLTESATETMKNSYIQINGKDAYAIMQNESNYVIIDARTDEEFAQGHIKDAILIPEYEIAQKAPSLLPNKDQLILVYCRSGRRSKIAAEALVNLGYTNVKEFGGIIDWEYETVT